MADLRQTPAQRELLGRVRARMGPGQLRLEDVAKRAGCSPSNMCRIMKGEIGMKAAIEARLAASFPVDEASVESAIEMIRGLNATELAIILQIMQLVQRLRTAGRTD